MLRYFLEGIEELKCEVTLAASVGGKVAQLLPPHVNLLPIPDNQPFSGRVLISQLRAITEAHRKTSFDLLHGWAARDWELTALAAWRTKRAGIGTLHDHPKADFIAPKRQLLMKWSARLGLARVICVSQAVRAELIREGLSPTQLVAIHNGIPSAPAARRAPNSVLNLGYLGGLSERKGIRTLFQIAETLAGTLQNPWQLVIAGDALDAAGKNLVNEMKQRYSNESWWSRIHWAGWIARPAEFLASLDLLICPSTEFDPFPTVLLEAGAAGTPVLASRVGGISEIVEEGVTGWLFDPGDSAKAAALAVAALSQKQLLLDAGIAAKTRVTNCFSISQMTAHYRSLYVDCCAQYPVRK